MAEPLVPKAPIVLVKVPMLDIAPLDVREESKVAEIPLAVQGATSQPSETRAGPVEAVAPQSFVSRIIPWLKKLGFAIALTAVPTLASAAEFVKNAAGQLEILIQKGDTLWAIEQKIRAAYESVGQVFEPIKFAIKSGNPDLIFVGEKIKTFAILKKYAAGELKPLIEILQFSRAF